MYILPSFTVQTLVLRGKLGFRVAKPEMCVIVRCAFADDDCTADYKDRWAESVHAATGQLCFRLIESAAAAANADALRLPASDVRPAHGAPLTAQLYSRHFLVSNEKMNC